MNASDRYAVKVRYGEVEGFDAAANPGFNETLMLKGGEVWTDLYAFRPLWRDCFFKRIDAVERAEQHLRGGCSREGLFVECGQEVGQGADAVEIVAVPEREDEKWPAHITEGEHQ